MSKEFLYERKNLTAPDYEPQILPVIQAWCDQTPFTPIKSWQEQTQFSAALEIPDYLLQLVATQETRSKGMVYAPYRGEHVTANPRSIDDVDLWEVTITLHHKGSKAWTIDAAGTHYCARCHTCAGHGKVSCDSCSGSGKNRCSTCSGSGQVSETQHRQEPRRCYECNGGGFTGYGDSRRRCTRCGGNGQRLEDVSFTVQVQCRSCAGHGRVVCGRCGGSGSLTCSSCEGAGQLLWWARITSQENQITHEVIRSGDSGYDPNARARTLAGDLSNLPGVAPTDASPAERRTRPLNSFAGLSPQPGYEQVWADYPHYQNLVAPSNIKADRAPQDWFIAQINDFKSSGESDYSRRLARLSYSIYRTPLTVVHYQHEQKAYTLWVNPQLGLVEDHDGPVAQAAAESLTQSIKLAEQGQLEAAFQWAARAVVTDDPRPHELAQRQQVAWQLNIQYTLGWLVGGLATFFIARSLGELTGLALSLGGAAFTFFIILACTKYVWLVRSTRNPGERFMVMACLGAAMIAGALFQPRGAGYTALGAILFSLLLLHWNRLFARPEKLRENKAGGGSTAVAKKIEQLVIDLQPNPALRTLRVALQYLWLLLATTLLGTGFYGYQLGKKLQKIEIWSAAEYRQSAIAHRLNPHLISLRSTTITQRLLATEPSLLAELLPTIPVTDLPHWSKFTTLAESAPLAKLLVRQNQIEAETAPDVRAVAEPLHEAIEAVALRSMASALTSRAAYQASFLALTAQLSAENRSQLLIRATQLSATDAALARERFTSLADRLSLPEFYASFALIVADISAHLPSPATDKKKNQPIEPTATARWLSQLATELQAPRANPILKTLGARPAPHELPTAAEASLQLFGEWLADTTTRQALTALAQGQATPVDALLAYYGSEAAFAAQPLGKKFLLSQSDRAILEKIQKENTAIRAGLRSPQPNLEKLRDQALQLIEQLQTVPPELPQAASEAARLLPVLRDDFVHYALFRAGRLASPKPANAPTENKKISPSSSSRKSPEAQPDRRRNESRTLPPKKSSGSNEAPAPVAAPLPATSQTDFNALLSILADLGVEPDRRQRLSVYREGLIQAGISLSAIRATTQEQLAHELTVLKSIAETTLTPPDRDYVLNLNERTAQPIREQLAAQEKKRLTEAAERIRAQQAAAARLSQVTAQAEKYLTQVTAARKKYAEFTQLVSTGQWRAAAEFLEKRNLKIPDENARRISRSLLVAGAQPINELELDPRENPVFPRHPVLERYKIALATMLYLDALAEVEKNRLQIEVETVTLAILGGPTTEAYRAYTESNQSIQRLLGFDSRISELDPATIMAWFTYSRLDEIAPQAQAQGFISAPTEKTNGLQQALLSLSAKLNGLSQAGRPPEQKLDQPRERLRALRQNLEWWTRTQPGLTLGSDLICIYQTPAQNLPEQQVLTLPLIRQGELTVTATGQIIATGPSSDAAGRILLLKFIRPPDDSSPCIIKLDDNGALEINFTQMQAIRL